MMRMTWLILLQKIVQEMDAAPFEVWLYRGLIAMLLIVVWVVLQKIYNNLSAKLDWLTSKANDQTTADALRKEQLEILEKLVEEKGKRIEDAHRRLDLVERTQLLCQHCREAIKQAKG